MALKFDRANFKPLERYTSRKDLAWSELSISFKDEESDCFPSIELTLLQKVGPATTIGELEKAAADHAKTILRAALDLLEKRDVDSLTESQFRS